MHFPLRLIIGIIFLLALSPSIFAADVYILRSIDIPQQYAGTPTTIDLVVENVQYANVAYASSLTQDMYVTIRNDQGTILQGFDNALYPIQFSSSTLNTQIVIPANTLQSGEVYTIDAKVDYYNPGGTTYDETTKGNNSARKTFTLLKAPQTYQVPDMPLELSFVSMLLVLSGLLYFGRVQKRN